MRLCVPVLCTLGLHLFHTAKSFLDLHLHWQLYGRGRLMLLPVNNIIPFQVLSYKYVICTCRVIPAAPPQSKALGFSTPAG